MAYVYITRREQGAVGESPSRSRSLLGKVFSKVPGTEPAASKVAEADGTPRAAWAQADQGPSESDAEGAHHVVDAPAEGRHVLWVDRREQGDPELVAAEPA